MSDDVDDAFFRDDGDYGYIEVCVQGDANSGTVAVSLPSEIHIVPDLARRFASPDRCCRYSSS
jgi:hypothetical protein